MKKDRSVTEFVETPKDQFITSVRSKLGKTDGSLSEAYEPLTENLSSIEDRVQETKVRLENRRADLVNDLKSVADNDCHIQHDLYVVRKILRSLLVGTGYDPRDFSEFDKI